MNKKKLFVIFFLGTVIFFLIFKSIQPYKSGDTSNVKIINKESNFFSKAETENAINKTILIFEKEKLGAQLLELEYSDELYTKNIGSYATYKKRSDHNNYIIIRSTFNTGPGNTLPANVEINNWLYIFEKKNNNWILINQGV